MPDRRKIRIMPIILCAVLSQLIVLTGFAQSESKPAGKTTTAAGQSCDGALDIVPSGSMTFIRKRRPAKTSSTQGKPAENKKRSNPGPEKSGPQSS